MSHHQPYYSSSTQPTADEYQHVLESFVMATSDAVYRMSADWQQMYQLVGKTFLPSTTDTSTSWLAQYIPLSDQQQVQLAINEAIAAKKPFELTHRVIRADGSLGWTFSRAIPLLNKQDEVTEWFGTASDITHRKQVEEALAQSEEKYRTLFNSIDEAVTTLEILFDENGKVADWQMLETNPAMTKMTGWTSEIVGQKASEFIPDAEAFWFEVLERVVKTGEPIRVEHPVAGLDGNWFEFYFARVGSQESRRVVCVYTNITERIRSEEQRIYLLALSDALRPLTDSMSVQIEASSLLGKQLRASRVFYMEVDTDGDAGVIHHDYVDGVPSITGHHALAIYPAPVLHQWSIGQTTSYADVETDASLSADQRAALATAQVRAWLGVPLLKEGRLVAVLTVHQSKPRVWLASEVKLVAETAERTWAALEAARAQQALHQSEARQRAILQSAKDYAIFTTDLDRHITSWSRGAQALFGYTALEILHQSADRLFTLGDNQQDAPRLEAQTAIRMGEAENERWHLRQDGSRFYGSGVITPLRDATGATVGLLKVMRDLTVQKRSEDTFKEANQRKDEFLAMLAHELRNPMATIRSGLQILTITSGNDQTSSATLTMMNRQTDQLVRIVDDLLDVSRISQGKIELKTQRLNLVDIVAQATESVQSIYRQQGRHLQVDLPTVPIYVEGDGVRLNQVVTNLLTNGARYTTESGQVWLRLVQQANPVGEPEALLEVADNGIGLEADQLTSIFELFVQVDTLPARSKGGLGLGLTLVKRLVELHGGWVEAQSEGAGKGSRFRVHLPALTSITQPTVKPSEGNPTKATAHRILVVDDNTDAALVLSMLLKLEGYEVYTRHSGQAGLEAIESLQPSVVLCDIGMPGMDGYETARLVRQQAWGQAVWLVALTGYGGAEDQQRSSEAGFDRHLVKPVDILVLTALLTDLLTKN